MTGGLLSLAHGARPVKVGVIGDLILDRYLRGEADRISPEAPIPVLAIAAEDERLGGSGNVAANLRSVGADVWVGGAVGADKNGESVRAALAEIGADVSAVIDDRTRPTVEKTRLIARSQQVLRYDREDRAPLAADAQARLIGAITRLLPGTDMVVLSDYAKGTLTQGVLDAVLHSGVPALVDPKGTDYSRYRGAFGITPNRGEAEAATHVKITDDESSLRRASDALFEITDVRVVWITLGAGGIYCRARGSVDAEFHVRSEARKVFDVTGAGDTVIALLARYLAAGVPLRQSVEIANAGAGVVVGKLGAVSIALAELYRAIATRGDGVDESARKIVTRAEAEALAADLRRQGLRVVFTNGCFDVLHAGHARYLAWARGQGDVLIVGMNDDSSVRRLKGRGRPMVAGKDRAELLAALGSVDFVVPFAEDTPEELIRAVTPDVLVKGADWQDKGVVGREWVESHGGSVCFAPLLEGRSTTGLIERIRANRPAGDGSEAGETGANRSPDVR